MLNDLNNFNEMFSKVVNYDNIPKKQGFILSISENCILRKTTEEWGGKDWRGVKLRPRRFYFQYIYCQKTTHTSRKFKN